MRIGIDARLWGPRGVGRYIQNLVIHLQKIDTNNEYVLFVGRDEFENVKCQISSFKFKIVIADIPWHSISEQINFPKILNQENLDLMHFPYFSVPIFYKKPFIITLHDLIVNKLSTGRASTLPFPLYQIKRIGYNFVVAEAVRKAKKIIVPTHAVKDELMRDLRIKDERIVVTYEASGLENQKQFEGKLQIGNWKIESGKYILYVGNAYPHKNLERLLSAISSSDVFGKVNFKLVLVGKEDYFYKRLKEKVKTMKLEDTVIFYGYATDEELISLYKNANALILPSLNEGFGLPAVEAMEVGCPIVVSDIPPLREVCGEAGIYINPHNISDIKEKIEMVSHLDTKKRNWYIKMGLSQSKKFSWETLAKKTLEIYESCIRV